MTGTSPGLGCEGRVTFDLLSSFTENAAGWIILVLLSHFCFYLLGCTARNTEFNFPLYWGSVLRLCSSVEACN